MTKKITRSHGTVAGGYNPGGGYSGATAQLDNAVMKAARLLADRFGDIEIRFNSDRKGGGAFLKCVPYSVGVSAQLWSLTESRRAWERWRDPETFTLFCQERGLNPRGPDVQMTFNVLIDCEGLRDRTLATEGAARAYAYLPAANIEEGVKLLCDHFKRTIED
jgi:hypothetical protein